MRRSLQLSSSLLLSTAFAVAGCGPSPLDVNGLGVTEQGLMVGTIDGEPVCAGDLAQKMFPYALCVCGDFDTASKLTTTGTHSGAGDGAGAAGIGVNGQFFTIGDAQIDGDLATGGNWSPIGEHDVAGNLYCGGDVEVTGDVRIEGDAHVAGDFTGIRAEVGGTVYQPADADLGWFIEAADTEATEVDVGLPCPCEAEDLIDVGLWVAQAEADNDNEAVGLQVDAFAGIDARGKQLALPAGRYLLEGIEARGPIRLSLDGPTALYVAGDLVSNSVFEVELENEDAELNLFVLGDIVATGVFHLGSSEAPGRVRTYVGGSNDIWLLGDIEIGGELYAPQARVIAAGPLELRGAALVGELVEAGRIELTFDAAVLEASATCQ